MVEVVIVGGGYGSPCNGGFNGRDGECQSGGRGTGENISSYYFENYKLSFGMGGEFYIHYTQFGEEYSGGGGGGVLINGQGPGKRVKENKVGVKEYRGEGFGGGGNYNEVDNDRDRE